MFDRFNYVNVVGCGFGYHVAIRVRTKELIMIKQVFTISTILALALGFAACSAVTTTKTMATMKKAPFAR